MSSSQITLAREGAKDVQVIAAGDENSLGHQSHLVTGR